jgi:hypothetical protein
MMARLRDRVERALIWALAKPPRWLPRRRRR